MPWSKSRVRGAAAAARENHCAVFHDNKLFLLGGADGDAVLSDVPVLATTGLMSWTTPKLLGQTPPARAQHTTCLVGKKMFVYGGRGADGELLADVVTLTADRMTWSRPRVQGDVPLGRAGHTCCAAGNVLLVYGGSTPTGETSSELYSFETGTSKWALLGEDGPPERTAHVAAVLDGAMYVIGGRGADGEVLGDVHAWDVHSRAWRAVECTGKAPPARADAAAAVVGGEIWILGGRGANGHALRDVHALDVATGAWREIALDDAPPPRHSATLTLCGRNLFVFGGSSGAGPSKELFSVNVDKARSEAKVSAKLGKTYVEAESEPKPQPEAVEAEPEAVAEPKSKPKPEPEPEPKPEPEPESEPEPVVHSERAAEAAEAVPPEPAVAAPTPPTPTTPSGVPKQTHATLVKLQESLDSAEQQMTEAVRAKATAEEKLRRVRSRRNSVDTRVSSHLSASGIVSAERARFTALLDAEEAKLTAARERLRALSRSVEEGERRDRALAASTADRLEARRAQWSKRGEGMERELARLREQVRHKEERAAAAAQHRREDLARLEASASEAAASGVAMGEVARLQQEMGELEAEKARVLAQMAAARESMAAAEARGAELQGALEEARAGALRVAADAEAQRAEAQEIHALVESAEGELKRAEDAHFAAELALTGVATELDMQRKLAGAGGSGAGGEDERALEALRERMAKDKEETELASTVRTHMQEIVRSKEEEVQALVNTVDGLIESVKESEVADVVEWFGDQLLPLMGDAISKLDDDLWENLESADAALIRLNPKASVLQPPPPPPPSQARGGVLNVNIKEQLGSAPRQSLLESIRRGGIRLRHVEVVKREVKPEDNFFTRAMDQMRSGLHADDDDDDDDDEEEDEEWE